MLKFLFLMLLPVLSFAQTEMTLVKENKAVLIDVREKDEVEQGMLDNARWVPLSSVNSEKIKKLKTELAGEKVFVYCRSGGRAGKFLKMLDLPQDQSQNLGGYEDLKAKGFEQKK